MGFSGVRGVVSCLMTAAVICIQIVPSRVQIAYLEVEQGVTELQTLSCLAMD
jgi:hypothetical protein